MNNWTCMCRFTNDPRVTYSKEEKPRAIAKFNIAVKRRFINAKEQNITSDFFNCVAFGKQAEFINDYMKKGMRVVIVGEVRNNNYEKDGVKHYGTQIIVKEIEFADSKGTEHETNDESNNEFVNIPDGIDEELPFN